MTDDDNNTVEGITVIPEPTRKLLNPRQQMDYSDHKTEFIRWLANIGKDPQQAEGYAQQTVRRRACDVDVFFRYVWDDLGEGYTTDLTHDHADQYIQKLAYSDYSDSHRANITKSLKCYFRMKNNPYDPPINFATSESVRQQPKDYLTKEERKQIKQASLEYGTVPNYNSLSPDQRDRWKLHLAQRFRKPSSDIGPKDFEKANGFKIPSIVYTALDAALRPIEVGRATTQWVDIENAVLRIPKDESSKNRDNWVVSLSTKTASMLERWINERGCYEKYEGSDQLWLTRESRQYSSRSLKYLLQKLCETAEIDTEHRDLTWYAIRHSTGHYMTQEGDIESAAQQLRHKSTETTRKYTHPSAEDRRNILDKIDE